MKTKLPALLVDIQEGVIDLGWGHPSSGLHPLAEISEASSRLFARRSTVPLQYGATQGYGPYLETLANFLSHQNAYGMLVDPKTLFLTAGASQALDLTCTLFAREGDTLLVEQPTYFVVEKIFKSHHLNVQGVPVDQYGLDVEVLEEMLESGLVHPRFIYTIPSYHNPTGTVLPEDRRKRLVELAHRFDFFILADEVYQLLYFQELPPRPVIYFDCEPGGKTISFGSFSKILSPGMRIGWIHTTADILSRFNDAPLTFSGGGFNHFVSALVTEVIDMGLLENNINKLRVAYSERLDAMDLAIRSNLGCLVDYDKVTGGYYLWLRLGDEINTVDLLSIAEQHGVSYRPGKVFSESGDFKNYLRLTYTLYEEEELKEGVIRLAEALTSFKNTHPLP